MAATYKTMKEIVYDTLREAIINGRYAPGHRLVADELAKELGVSRMPVREAIHRLEAAGLVSSSPHRGAVVSELSEQEVIEIYHIRAVLDGLAARLAVGHLRALDCRMMDSLLNEMDEAVRVNDTERLLRINRDFHLVIWEAAGAPRLQELLVNLYDASTRFRNISINLPGRLDQLTQEHRLIALALENGDAAAAEHYANEHHEGTAKRLLHSIEHVPADHNS